MPDERDAAALYNFMSGLKSKLGFGECWFMLTGDGIMIEWHPTRDLCYREIVGALNITACRGCHMDTYYANMMRAGAKVAIENKTRQSRGRTR